MSSINQLMMHDHRHCDTFFADAENAVDRADWEQAASISEQFFTAMERHFSAEEQTLFPAFEQQTGMTQGPTQVMRAEHSQMRALLAQMRAAVQNRQRDDYLGCSETLLILMQQHNMKEEGILYPMCDAQLGEQLAPTHQQLDAQLQADGQ